MSEIWLIRSTCSSREEAASIARKLLAEKLIACANISSESVAIYRWENTLQEEDETVLLVKTRADKVDRAMACIKEMHSYQTPSILAWPVAKADEAFSKWIDNEV